MQGFLRCTPPALPHLEMSTFVSTVGRTAGDTIANLTVSPTTTLVAAVLTNTSPPDLQARAAELIALLRASDPDLSLLAQASTVLYTAQLANGIDIAFSASGSEDSPDGVVPMGEVPMGEAREEMRAMAGPFRPCPALAAILRSRWMVLCCATSPLLTYWPMAPWCGQTCGLLPLR